MFSQAYFVSDLDKIYFVKIFWLIAFYFLVFKKWAQGNVLCSRILNIKRIYYFVTIMTIKISLLLLF